MADDESIRLFADWKLGDQDAAFAIFERYVGRLSALARCRLSPRLQQRVDPDDVVQSAYRIFFDRARKNEFQIEHSGDLWRLLAAITIKKIHSQVEFHQAQKRSYSQDFSLCDDSSGYGIPREIIDREPTPAESTALIEELETVLAMLEPSQRAILERRLQGETVEEIADAIERSDRTVRRTLEQVRKILESRLIEGG
jgi:RNA polymerase sigma-70 factor (ECF subfamily)